MLQRLSSQTLNFFRFLGNEPLVVFKSDFLIVSFRVWEATNVRVLAK